MAGRPAYTIRPAGPDDTGRLALVGAATFLESFAGLVDGSGIVEHCRVQHAPETYARYLDAGARAFLAEAEPGGAPVGYAMLTAPELEQAGPGDLELKRIYLLSRFHGSGIAAGLMDAAVSAAGGAPRLLLGVKNDNDRALGFYRKQGFGLIGTRRFSVGGHQYDDFVLARNLICELTGPT